MDQLEPDQFHQWKEAAIGRAEGKNVVEISRELVSLAENGETMTMTDAKILGMVYELNDRLEGN